jgi:hypothetical protein
VVGNRHQRDRDVITDADVLRAMRALSRARPVLEPTLYIVRPNVYRARLTCPLWTGGDHPDHVHTLLCVALWTKANP